MHHSSRKRSPQTLKQEKPRYTWWSWISSITTNVPYIFATIAILLCFLLIWNSLNFTSYIPNYSFSDVADFGANFSFLSTTSINNASSFIPEGTLHQDFEKSTRDVLTLFLQEGIPNDATSTSIMTKLTFPHLGIASCSERRNTIIIPKLPIDEYPNIDPYIPWIHDYHINYPIASEVRFIAQNKRRCHTGIKMETQMKYWEPQMALFQSISIQEEESMDSPQKQYRLASMNNATYKETRFLCHFHGSLHQDFINVTTLSTYFFNYEYVAWRKGSNYLPMYKDSGRDVSNFLLSQLLFQCPIPPVVRDILLSHTLSGTAPLFYVDIIPIRTPPRYTELPMVTMDMVGPKLYKSLVQDKKWLDVVNAYNANNNKVVPEIERSGRYANLPLCGPLSTVDTESQSQFTDTTLTDKQYHLVACTWTSASYNRRGDKTVIDDATSRLLEWIVFHRLVGIDHIYIYDNTQIIPGGNATSPLQEICQQFPGYITYISWPASVCNNNRPNHKNPGERSSQYAAEASCRSRFGDFTDWMTFIDTDEYIVPMMKQPQERVTASNGILHPPNLTTWHEVLQEMEDKGYHILKMPSSRGRPRITLMEETVDITESVCANNDTATHLGQLTNNDSSCLVPRGNETYLRVYKYERFV